MGRCWGPRRCVGCRECLVPVVTERRRPPESCRRDVSHLSHLFLAVTTTPQKTSRMVSCRRLSKVAGRADGEVWFIREIVICQADCLGVTGTRLGEDSHEKNSPICRVGHSCSPHDLDVVVLRVSG